MWTGTGVACPSMERRDTRNDSHGTQLAAENAGRETGRRDAAGADEGRIGATVYEAAAAVRGRRDGSLRGQRMRARRASGSRP